MSTVQTATIQSISKIIQSMCLVIFVNVKSVKNHSGLLSVQIRRVYAKKIYKPADVMEFRYGKPVRCNDCGVHSSLIRCPECSECVFHCYQRQGHNSKITDNGRRTCEHCQKSFLFVICPKCDDIHYLDDKPRTLNTLSRCSCGMTFNVTYCPECEHIGANLAVGDSQITACPNCKKPIDSKKKIRPLQGKASLEEVKASDDEDTRLCIVCVENPKVMMTEPCHHVSMCEPCSRQYKNNTCPVCRGLLLRWTKLFF
eukprot:TRINITY_DN9875_c0_g1_i1.p1 TRINITY_DN9875_c0_g1~~TRINITY_DN9875_c0_g1_i1.p1  ORF type:complete len:256 (+),score=-10.83 TRINITY_DN9875_c0_g1_i1:281-1048(+)